MMQCEAYQVEIVPCPYRLRYGKQAAGMVTWLDSEVRVGSVPEDDRAFATRLARSCARHPVALTRLTYDRTDKAVTYRSDQSVGTETVDPLACLARVLVHSLDEARPDAGRRSCSRSSGSTCSPARRPVAPHADRRHHL